MKTWQIILIIAIIVALGIIGILALKHKDPDDNKTESKTEQTNSQPQVNSNQNTNTTTSMEDIDIKNKFVTLNVQGFGDIKLELYDEDAPKAVENFLALTKKGYYDGIIFHRIIKGFMIQGGDPTGTGSGGESIFGETFADELNPDTASYRAGYVKGVLAMANRGPNTNGSQFFIMLEDTPLPHNYTIFGKVVVGQDVVDKIGSVATNPGDSPKDKVVITKATISDN